MTAQPHNITTTGAVRAARSFIWTHDGTCIVIDPELGNASGRSLFEAERELERRSARRPEKAGAR